MIRGNINGNVSNVGNYNYGIIGDGNSVDTIHSGHTTTINRNKTRTTVGNITAGNGGGGGNGAGNGGAGGNISLTLGDQGKEGNKKPHMATKFQDMRSGSGGNGGDGEEEGGAGGAGGSTQLNMSKDASCEIESVAAGDGGEGGRGSRRGGQGGTGGNTTLNQR